MLLFLPLYNLAIRLYYFTILIASSRNEKAKQWIDGRKKLLKTVSGSLKNGEKRIWFHCASVGEFEQARPLIEACKEKFPAYKIVLTFFSPSGYEFRKNYRGADYIFYLPLDTKRNAHEFISLVEPKVTVFVKYEFWFHFFNELVKRKIPTIMISVVLRKNHFLFSVFSAPLRKAVMNLNRVFVQDAHSAELLNSQGFSNAAIAGDTRFDRVWDIAFSPVLIPLIEKFKGGPVGITTIATAVGEEPGTLEEVYEPFLIKEGFIMRTARGREVTEKAYKHLKRTPRTNMGDGMLFV